MTALLAHITIDSEVTHGKVVSLGLPLYLLDDDMCGLGG